MEIYELANRAFNSPDTTNHDEKPNEKTVQPKTVHAFHFNCDQHAGWCRTIGETNVDADESVYLAAFAGERPEVEAGGGLVADLAQLIHLKQETTIRITKKSFNRSV